MWWHELDDATRARAVRWDRLMRSQGVEYIITSVRRSRAVDARILRTAGVTCPGCTTAHQTGQAFDAVSTDPVLARKLWKRLGGKSSADDPQHFE